MKLTRARDIQVGDILQFHHDFVVIAITYLDEFDQIYLKLEALIDEHPDSWTGNSNYELLWVNHDECEIPL